jgi:hypothetical protein
MSVKLADGITAEEIEKVMAGNQKAETPPAAIIPAESSTTTTTATPTATPEATTEG